MKNSLLKTLYHAFVCRRHRIRSFRGGWMLAHSFWMDYRNRKAGFLKIARIHMKGWCYEDWMMTEMTDDRKSQYLSTRDYCAMHPFNGTYSSWIDDKLTLKYVLDGTPAGKYMPDYYFQLQENGKVLSLMDAGPSWQMGRLEDIVNLLQAKKCLAFKLIKGSLGVGFYKATYMDDQTYWLNHEQYTKEQFIQKLSTLSGYLVTEFLLPHRDFAKYCDKSVGCLRYIIGRRENGDLEEVYSFMRFGTLQSKFVENFNSGGVLVIVRDGYFNGGYTLDMDTFKKRSIDVHPDNHIPLKGEIPMWNDVVKAAHDVAKVLPQMSYMGIDFCITHDERIKIIEINSLTSLDALQLDRSIYETKACAFFKEKLKTVE